MALVFHRGLSMPLWAIVLCVFAITSPSLLVPSVVAAWGIALIASVMMTFIWRMGILRPAVAVAPIGRRGPGACDVAQRVGTSATRAATRESARRARAEKATDASDLVRMDDDGGGPSA
jgi:hypothetical protein